MLATKLNPEEKQLYAYCLSLLKTRDYSENELKTKAKTKGYSNNAITTVLNLIKQQNLVNDRRLAENLLEYYQPNKGVVWLRQKMRQRQIPTDIIEQVLQNHSKQPDISHLRQLLAKKYQITRWQNGNQIDPKTKLKIVNFLSNKGYPNPYELLRQIFDNQF